MQFNPARFTHLRLSQARSRQPRIYMKELWRALSFTLALAWNHTRAGVKLEGEILLWNCGYAPDIDEDADSESCGESYSEKWQKFFHDCLLMNKALGDVLVLSSNCLIN